MIAIQCVPCGFQALAHIARLMGGDAGVASRRGEGSRFWFTARLDAADPAAQPRAGPEREQEPPHAAAPGLAVPAQIRPSFR